jgi:mono/diheme cytochrome c family protein
MKKTSSDHFGIYVESDDPDFDEKELKALLGSLKPVEIVEIFNQTEEENYSAVNAKFVGALVVLFLVVSVATWLHLDTGLNSLPFNWMDTQPKYSAQSESSFFADGSAMRNPVEGTVARGYMPYPYPKEPEMAAKFLVNPLLPTEDVLARGKQEYDIFCGVCHGDHGKGDGRLKGKFPIPPSLHSKKVREDWTDGRIYHVLTMGQNAMPSYAKQIPSDDRWAIIQYLRVLQRSLNAKESDLQ